MFQHTTTEFLKKLTGPSRFFFFTLTLIYPAHFEDVPCQSGVNHIFEGYENYVSRHGIYIIVKRNV